MVRPLEPPSAPARQAVQRSLRPGTEVLGRWIVQRKIGHGSFGQVFLVHDNRTKAPAALKLFPLKGPQLPFDATDGFFDELKWMSSFTHQAIVKTIDMGYNKLGKFVVCDYVPGGNLRHHLIRHVRLPISQALALTKQIAEVLSFTHSRGLAHCDLKPENILLTRTLWPFQVKLCDFGHARYLDASTGSTKEQRAFGSLGYMAPEQWSQRYDHRADFYSLGVILFELLFGHRPNEVEEGSFALVLERYMKPHTASLRRIILGLLAAAPEARYPDADELIEDLERALIEHRTLPYTSSSDRIETLPQSLSLAPLWSMAYTRTGDAWVVARGGGLLRVHGEHLLHCDAAGHLHKSAPLGVPESVVPGSRFPGPLAWFEGGCVMVQWELGGEPVCCQAPLPLRMGRLDPEHRSLLAGNHKELYLFSQDGTCEWCLTLPSYGDFPALCLSQDGETICLCAGSPQLQLSTLNRKGEVLHRLPIKGHDVSIQALPEAHLCIGCLGTELLQFVSLGGAVYKHRSLPSSLEGLAAWSEACFVAICEQDLVWIDTHTHDPVMVLKRPDEWDRCMLSEGILYGRKDRYDKSQIVGCEVLLGGTRI